MVLLLVVVAASQPTPTSAPLTSSEQAGKDFLAWSMGLFLAVLLTLVSSVIFGVCEKGCGFLKTISVWAGGAFGVIFFVLWGTLYQTGHIALP